MAFSFSALAAEALTVAATYDGADLEGATVPAGGAITLTFSNNVTDDNVLAGNKDRIKVKDAEGAEAASTVSPEGNNAFVVTLGDLSKGSYTLTVGKELTAKNGNTLGTKVEIAFQVNKGTGSGTGGGGGNNPLNFVSAKANGADLAGAELAASGSITVTFDRGMTENQEANFAQIGIYNAAGEKVTGVTFTDFTKDDDGNSYTVLSYSGLAGGAYTLKLGGGLKANNGNTLGEDVTINFTVKAAETPDEGGNSGTNTIMNIIKTVMNFLKMILNFFKSLIK